MRSRLKLKGYSPDIIEAVVESLKKALALDDEKFARLWVESRMQTNPMGDIVLRRELKEKGISDRIIEATLADKASHYDEYKVAFAMASERFKQLVKLDKRKALKRLYDYLMRRGFGFETVQRVIEDLKGQGLSSKGQGKEDVFDEN